jgi:serine/threonine-protein kinase 24/25/MST4
VCLHLPDSFFYSSQGTVRKSAVRDFSDRSEGTGTVRVVSRPPQIASTKDGRSDMPKSPKAPIRTADRENQWRSSGTGSEESLSLRDTQSGRGRVESSTDDVIFWLLACNLVKS